MDTSISIELHMTNVAILHLSYPVVLTDASKATA